MPFTKEDNEHISALLRQGSIEEARMYLAALEGARAAIALTKFNERYPQAADVPSPAPSPPAADEIAAIKQAFLEHRYDDARDMLIVSDHPEAEKLRQRMKDLGMAGVVAGVTSVAPAEISKDFTNQFLVCIVLLFVAVIPGLIALEIFSGEARKYPDAPHADSILLTRVIIWSMIALAIGVLLLSLFSASRNRY